MIGKSAANRPGFVLVCSAAAVLGTVGAWHFLEGPDPVRRPARAAASAPKPPVEEGADGGMREQHRQYVVAIERALATDDPRQRDTAFAVLLPELLAADPAAAVHLVNRQPPGKMRVALRDEMARRWVLQDREGALSWVESLAEEERAAAAIIAVRTLAAESPELAISTADRFGIGRDDGSLEHIAQAWAETDPDAARRWAARQAPGSPNATLRTRIEQTTARQDRDTR